MSTEQGGGTGFTVWNTQQANVDPESNNDVKSLHVGSSRLCQDTFKNFIDQNMSQFVCGSPM